MVTPAETRWSFARLGRTRQEVARLESLEVLSADEAARLREAIGSKEGALGAEMAPAAAEGAFSFYRLVAECVAAGDTDHVPVPLARRLESFYERQQPRLVETLGSLAPAAAEPEAPDGAEAQEPVATTLPTVAAASPIWPPPPVGGAESREAGPPEGTPDGAPADTSAETEPAAGWSLARFLETVNIGWGMFAASLLIIGCSIALVITLWRSEVPLIRYLTFLGVTLGLNMAGQFAVRRLRLAITGGTLLALSLALMPLNLIASELFGGPTGRVIPVGIGVAIWVALAAVAGMAFRTVYARSAAAAGAGFAALIGLQLTIGVFGGPGGVAGAMPAWLGTAVLYVALAFAARRLRAETELPTALKLVFTAGLLLFAHLLLWVRVHLDVAAGVGFGGVAPVVVALLFGVLWLARELARREAEGEWCLRVAVALATLAHFALPLVVGLVFQNHAAEVLPTAVAAMIVYAIVAAWYRSEWAVVGAALAAALAACAGLAHLHLAPGEAFVWQPVPLQVLAFRLLPLVAVFLVTAEGLARLCARDDFGRRAWRILAIFGAATAALLLGVLVTDVERLARGVSAVGAFMLVMALTTRRSGYARAALAAAPLAFALGPFGLRPAMSEGALDLGLAGFALAYAAGTFLLRRARGVFARVFAPAFEPVALALVPPILLVGLHSGAGGLAVPSAAAAALVCLLLAAMRRSRGLAHAAGIAYLFAVGQAIHHGLAPWPGTAPAAAVWLLVAALAPIAYALLAGRRPSLPGVATFRWPAVLWGTALVWGQLVVFGQASITAASAFAAVGSAAALLALAALQRNVAWTWMGIVYLGFSAFFIYQQCDPLLLGAWAGHGILQTWLPLAPIGLSVVLLVAAAMTHRGRHRQVFEEPMLVASVIAALLAFALLIMSPAPARKVWTIALVLASISAIHLRVIRTWVFLAALLLLGWIATIGLAFDLLPTEWSRESERLLFTLLVVGTTLVAVGAIVLERLLRAHAARPAGAWLRGMSLLATRIIFGAAALGVIVPEAVFAVAGAAANPEYRPELPVWPLVHPVCLLMLIGAGLASIRGSGKPRLRITLGLTGGVAAIWPICYLHGADAARYVSVALAAYAAGWLVFSVIEPLRARLAGWCGVVEGRVDRFWFVAKTGFIITIGSLVAVGAALARPDDPATVAAGAIFTAAALAIAAAGRRPGWLVAGIVLASLTAMAALHRVMPYPPIEEGKLYPDALFPFAVLFAALGALWYGLRVLGRRRAAAGRAPRFRPAVLGVSALLSSLVALGLLAAFITPALQIEPTAMRFEYVAGAVLIGLITIAYLVIAAHEKQPALVYLAEACIAGFCLYLRVTHPWIYRTHFFRRLWPLVVVGIAFGATGLEQLLRRLPASRIFAGPLRFTGLLLPLGPLVGVWLRPEIDNVAITTLGAIAAFYAWIAYLNRSTVFAYVSTIIANVTMMAWAHRLGWNFHIHPQIFLWPIGLSLIAVAQVQRRRLSDAVVQALRGIGASIIYGSMATAIFTDLSHQTLEMCFLALACLAGIGAGIGFKIRAFLYAGFGFLIFDVVYMVFRAGREDTWIWWISGIALGVTVLFAFAFFEKRRQDVEHWVGKLKQWD